MNLAGKLLLLLTLIMAVACTDSDRVSDASNSISFDKKTEAQKSFESVSI